MNRKRRRNGKLKRGGSHAGSRTYSKVVSFLAVDGEEVEMLHDDALIVEAIIHNFKVQKIIVDDGSKVNLLPYRVFKAMKIPDEDMVRDQALIKGIGRVPLPVEGKVKLLPTLGVLPIT